MTLKTIAAGLSPMVGCAHGIPAQTGLGWREFFERLGQGTLPQPARHRDRAASAPIRSFAGYRTRPEPR